MSYVGDESETCTPWSQWGKIRAYADALHWAVNFRRHPPPRCNHNAAATICMMMRHAYLLSAGMGA